MSVLIEVNQEVARNSVRWGADHDDAHTPDEWQKLLQQRTQQIVPWYSAETRRRALVELAAISIAAIESLDRLT